DLVIEAGETVSVVGANGAGKTTMLRTISGLLRPRGGEVRFDGERIDRLPCHRVVERGVVHVPEGRKGFRGSPCERTSSWAPTHAQRRPSAPTASSECSRSSRAFANGCPRRQGRSRVVSSRCWLWAAHS